MEREFSMDAERTRLITRNIELLIRQLEIEIDDEDRIKQRLVYSIQCMLKSIETNLRAINERKELN
jgi:hypothetical protein